MGSGKRETSVTWRDRPAAVGAHDTTRGMTMFKSLKREIDVVFDRDPAARSRIEVVLCYPGFHAMLFYRLANWLWRRRRFLLGRYVSHVGRVLTGIEIHPGATIGRGLFIDHGVGVVIGETAEIGDDVTLYQGVTLGGTSLEKGKRHPTVETGAIIGAGAKVLGPLTVGAGARVGSNAVVVKDVPAGATVVGIPGRVVKARGGKAEAEPRFAAYAQDTANLPDPVARVVDGLLTEVRRLQERVEQLEGERGETAAEEGENGGKVAQLRATDRG